MTDSTRMDVVARGLDLTTAILKSRSELIKIAIDTTTSLSTSASDILHWIAHERISKTDYVYAMFPAEDFAMPNKNGLAVLETAKKYLEELQPRYGLAAKSNVGVLFSPSGALGQKIIPDKHLQWMVTTQASLIAEHDQKYAVDTFCALLARRGLADNPSAVAVITPRIRPVISKVVSSIHLHTTNMGYNPMPLPEGLAKLSKHHIAAKELALAIEKLKLNEEYDMVMEMEGCVVDLIAWVFHHWGGRLVVAVNSKKVVDEDFGNTTAELMIMITDSQRPLVQNSEGKRYRIVRRVGSKFPPQVAKGPPIHAGPVHLNAENSGSSRSPLYEIRNPHRTSVDLNSLEKKEAEKQARRIVRSIMNLPVTPETPARKWLGFSVNPKSQVKYSWWLKRTPGILQKNRGEDEKWEPRLLFDPHQRAAPEAVVECESRLYTVGEIASWYPEILAGLQSSHERCSCDSCMVPGSNNEKVMLQRLNNLKMDPGCFLILMYAEIMLHIGHALAEAAGAHDISNLHAQKTAIQLSEITASFLGQIAERGSIYWETWFRLAVTAITGLRMNLASSQHGDTHTRETLNRGELVFCVVGGMTVLPKWANSLTIHSELEGSWSVLREEGCIKGLESETALVETDGSIASDSSNWGDPFKLPPKANVTGGKDSSNSKIKMQCAFFRPQALETCSRSAPLSGPNLHCGPLTPAKSTTPPALQRDSSVAMKRRRR